MLKYCGVEVYDLEANAPMLPEKIGGYQAVLAHQSSWLQLPMAIRVKCKVKQLEVSSPKPSP